MLVAEELGIGYNARIGWDTLRELGRVYDIPWGRSTCLSKVRLLASLTMYYKSTSQVFTK